MTAKHCSDTLIVIGMYTNMRKTNKRNNQCVYKLKTKQKTKKKKQSDNPQHMSTLIFHIIWPKTNERSDNSQQQQQQQQQRMESDAFLHTHARDFFILIFLLLFSVFFY